MSVPQNVRIWLLPALTGLIIGLVIVWGMPEREPPAPQPRLAPTDISDEPLIS